MSFIQPCFIRKNTSEIIHKLEELGYSSHIFNNNDGNNIYVDKLGTYISADIEDSYYIDCDDNEVLFIALAALRDDISEKQWFVMDVEVYSNISKGEWFLSTNPQGGKHVGTQIDPLYCHKATVSEIIEHFKTNLNIKAMEVQI